ncbi:cytochrome p450 [Moniliophthora roreri]|nr:cytochrome p450 [Moniliophthora roreri]
MSVFLSALLLLILPTVALLPRRRVDDNSPPGPTGLPFLGNLLDLTRDAPWKTYKRWGERYGSGSVCTFRIIGRVVLVINTLQDCRELLEKRPHIYSDRPKVEMLSKMGWDFNLVFIPYQDERFQKYRRAIVRGIGSASDATVRPTVSERCNVLLQALLKTPGAFETHLRDYMGSVLLQHVFGFTDYSEHRSFIHDTVVPAIEGMTGSAFWGAQILFAFPWLGKIPSWVPGMSFLKTAQEQLLLAKKILNEPVDQVKEQMRQEPMNPSWAQELLSAENAGDASNSLSEGEVREITSSVITGGIDTTTSALKTIVLAMLLHPEFQKRAQDEIDAVTGGDRLPDFDDSAQLVYVTAICKEALRWSPPLPVASHSTSSADVYQGYRIQKDAAVAVNLWAMSRDTKSFKDPEEFLPDRYLEESADPDSLSVSWGFGRRSCPGRNLAESMLLLAAARILAVYNIGNKRTPDGKEVKVHPEFVSQGILLQPKSFQCSFVPRSHEARLLIERLGS